MKNDKETRDDFAGQALQGLLSARCPDALVDVKVAAKYAYNYADAMMTERTERGWVFGRETPKEGAT